MLKTPGNIKKYAMLPWALKVVPLLVLMPLFACAQFAKINLDIPSKCGFNEVNPLEFTTIKDRQTGLQKLNGTAVFSISANENIQVLLRLKNSDTVVTEQLPGTYVNVFAAFRNDGFTGQHDAKTFNGTDAGFSLSNCGRIIGNIVDHPARLSAFLFLTLIGEIKPGTTDFEGNLDIQIEYN